MCLSAPSLGITLLGPFLYASVLGTPVPDVSWVIKEGAEGNVLEDSGMQAG